MVATAPRRSRRLRSAALPISLGLLAGGFATLVLTAMSPIWLALFMAAIAVLAGGFMVKDLGRYWMVIFVLAIPFRMGKMFFAEPPDIMAFIEEFGRPQGSLPVPQMLLADLPFVAMLAVFLVRFVKERAPFRMSPTTPIVLALMAWTGLTLVNCTVKMLGIMEFARQLEYALIFVVVAQLIRERRDLWAIVVAVAVSLTIQAVYTFLQYEMNITLLLFGADSTTLSNTSVLGADTLMVGESGGWAETRRGSGTVGHPNLTAHYFEMWTPLVAAFVMTARHRLVRLVLGATVVIAAMGLFLTFSRGGAVAFSIGIAAAFFALWQAGHFSRRVARAIMGIGFAGALAAAPVGYWYMTTRPEMFQDRFELLDVGVNMVADKPLLGVGVNHFKARFLDYRGDKGVQPHPLHNYYLLLAAERGIPAVLIFIVLMFALLRIGWIQSKSADPAIAATAAGVFGMLVGVTLHMSFDAFTDDPGQRGFWLLLGMLVALGRLREHDPVPARTPD